MPPPWSCDGGEQLLLAPNSGCLCLDLRSTTEEHFVLGQFNQPVHSEGTFSGGVCTRG